MKIKAQRRTSAKNFTISETLLLCKILKKHKHIIENTKNDGATIIEKEKAWRQVVKEFNSTSKGCNRTMRNLQLNYRNLNKTMNKKYASTKMQLPADKSTYTDGMKDSDTPIDSWDEVASNTDITAEVCQEVLLDFINEADIQEEEVAIKFGSIADKSTYTDGMKDSDTPIDNWDEVASNTDITAEVCQEVLLDFINEADIQEEEVAIKFGSIDDQSSDPLIEKQETMEIEKPENYDIDNSATDISKLRSDKQAKSIRKTKQQSADEETAALNLKIVMYQRELLRVQLIEEEEKLEHNRILREMEYEDAREKYEHNALIRKLQVEKYINK